MKIRIQDNSIRLRLTLREVESLADGPGLVRTTQVINTDGPGGLFTYALEADPSLAETVVEVDGPSIRVRLSAADRDALLSPREEGVYVRREWRDADGSARRFMVFVEKDRPGSTCVKTEQWIYDAPPHGPVETRPIPARDGAAAPGEEADGTTPARRLADLAIENPARAEVFDRHRIDYCCGGWRSLKDVCARAGLDPATVAAELDACDAAAPRGTDWTRETCAGLVADIVETHHAVVRRDMPELAAMADRVAEAHGHRSADLVELAGVVRGLRAELEAHIEKEERVLFPYIVRLEQGGDSPFPTIGVPISCMEDDHLAAADALSRIRHLTNHHTPPDEACDTCRALFAGLEAFGRDLRMHIHKENNILFPRAIAMERELRGRRES